MATVSVLSEYFRHRKQNTRDITIPDSDHLPREAEMAFDCAVLSGNKG